MSILSTLVFLAAPTSSASECTDLLVGEVATPGAQAARRQEAVDPALVLKRKGLDPEKFRFELKWKGSPAHFIKLFVTYDGEPCLFMSFNKVSAFGDPMTQAFRTYTGALEAFRGDPEYFRNKGVGTMAYLVAAKLIYARWGEVIASDDPTEVNLGTRMVSNSAMNVWTRFKEQGLAKSGSVGLGMGYKMTPEALAGPRFELVEKFTRDKIEISELP